MSRDLTDHVRERDEAEGPPRSRPVTDKLAEHFRQFADEVEAKWPIGSKFVFMRLIEHNRRLLRDRDVAMEIIEGFVQVMREEYSIGDPVERATDRASVFAQARALITAVKEERE